MSFESWYKTQKDSILRSYPWVKDFMERAYEQGVRDERAKAARALREQEEREEKAFQWAWQAGAETIKALHRSKKGHAPD